ncbi:hypothetical protein NQZ68_011008 [Dissostichus eleginoides]|nr:hypothetical protein NQZ68_011008 [Dissostichus eleginoides]
METGVAHPAAAVTDLTSRDRPGIGGLVQTNRRLCGWSRVATRHNKPPSPAQCATASEGPAFLVSWQPNSNMSNSEVRSDGGWELMFSTTWFGQLDVYEMEQNTQRGLCALPFSPSLRPPLTPNSVNPLDSERWLNSS